MRYRLGPSEFVQNVQAIFLVLWVLLFVAHTVMCIVRGELT